MRKPWFKFFVGDWLACLKLKRCSLSAQGLWVRILCLAHQSEPYGHLEVESLAELASLVGRPELEVERALVELEKYQVFSRSASGAIVSRRMVRDADLSQKRASAGSKGGSARFAQANGQANPKQSAKQKGKQNVIARARGQKPEARDQKEPPTEASSPTPPGKPETVEIPDPLLTPAFRAAWVDWLAYRVQRKLKAYVPLGETQQLARLAQWGPARAVEAIRHSIAQGYQGVFEPKAQDAPRSAQDTRNEPKAFAAIRAIRAQQAASEARQEPSR